MTEYEKFDKQDAKMDEMKRAFVSLFEDLVKFTESDDDAYRKGIMLNVTCKIERMQKCAEEIVKLQKGEW